MWIKKGSDSSNRFGSSTAKQQPVYGAYSVPVQNEFSDYQMCPTPALQPKRCASCGTEIEPNAKFCTECGAPVGK